MMCNICNCEYSSPSAGGPGVCPACDCGVHPDTVRRATAEARIRDLEAQCAAKDAIIADFDFKVCPSMADRISQLEAALCKIEKFGRDLDPDDNARQCGHYVASVARTALAASDADADGKSP